jgi:iron complex outermembrane receptor protein
MGKLRLGPLRPGRHCADIGVIGRCVSPSVGAGGRLAARAMSSSSAVALRAAMCASTLVGVLAAAPLARAADADHGAPTQTEPNTVAPVYVTAERRVVNLQKAAVAATVLTGAQLRDAQVTTVEQLQQVTPAMSVSSGLQGNQVEIRGIGRGDLSGSVTSGVQVSRDGIQTFEGFLQNEPYYDLSSIQVLRGPQGTFASSDATGGVIVITEANPSIDGVSGYAEIGGGNYGRVDSQGAVNLPLSSTFAIRLAADHESHGTFFHVFPSSGFSGNPGNLESDSLRFSALWKPNSQFQALLKLDGHYGDIGGYPATPNPGGSLAGLACPQERADIFNFCTNAKLSGFERQARGVLDLRYEFANGLTLRSISGFQWGTYATDTDLDGTGIVSEYFHDLSINRIWSEEVDLISPETSALRWIIGGSYHYQTSQIGQGGFLIGLNTPPVSILNIFNFPIERQSAAAFGQITYEISPALEVQAGLRFMDNNFRTHDTTVFGGALVLNQPVSGVGFARESDSKLVGKVALNWKVTPDQFLYAFVATGHKGGGANSIDGTLLAKEVLGLDLKIPVLFKPEDVTDFEAGWKGRWFGGHLRTQLGIFYNDYKNYQINATIPGTPSVASAGFAQITNVGGSTKDWGFEGQAQAVVGQWSLDATVGYTNTRLGEASEIAPLNPQPGFRDVTGHSLAFAPPWTFSIGAQYTIDLGGENKLIPRVDFSHTDAQWSDVFDETPGDASGDTFNSRLAERNLVNATLTFKHGNLSATLWVTNLTDQHYVDSLDSNLRYPGAPRQFGVRVRQSF